METRTALVMLQILFLCGCGVQVQVPATTQQEAYDLCAPLDPNIDENWHTVLVIAEGARNDGLERSAAINAFVEGCIAGGSASYEGCLVCGTAIVDYVWP